MERKELGRIQKASFGWGGYQDVMIGVTFQLGGEGWGIADHRGMWGTERSDTARWSEENRLTQLGEVCMWLGGILRAAKKTDVEKLVGTPVEVIFDGNKLVSWRVLTEVL